MITYTDTWIACQYVAIKIHVWSVHHVNHCWTICSLCRYCPDIWPLLMFTMRLHNVGSYILRAFVITVTSYERPLRDKSAYDWWIPSQRYSHVKAFPCQEVIMRLNNCTSASGELISSQNNDLSDIRDNRLNHVSVYFQDRGHNNYIYIFF